MTILTSPSSPPKLSRFSRFFFWVLTLPLLFIAGVQLFVLSGQTEMYFAWTFASPLPAAFLGAGYWAAMVHPYLAVRSGSWAFTRTSIPGAFSATVLLSITTFLHLDKFHLTSPVWITQFVTWVWVVIYVIVPPLLLILLFSQVRSPQAQVKGHRPLPNWMRLSFMGLALWALGCGLSLFLVPEATAQLWPWGLAPLAARTTGAWFCAFGIICFNVWQENDLQNGAGSCASLFVFCTLELVVLARYVDLITWANPLSWAVMLFLALGLGVTGANLWVAYRRPN